MQLGGNIELSGFRALDTGSLIIVKKILGNYARKMQSVCGNFERLAVTMKPVHSTEASTKFEVHGKVIDNGIAHVAAVTDRNLFVVLDLVLKKIEGKIKK